MNARDNLLSLLKREGYDFVPVELMLCQEQIAQYREKTGNQVEYEEYFKLPWRYIPDLLLYDNNPSKYLKYYHNLKEGAEIDFLGVAHEPGSEAAKHMTKMLHPLKGEEELSEIKKYPFPEFNNADNAHQKKLVDDTHKLGLAAVGNMQMTIWEASWYIRSMEDMMIDMMTDNPIAEYILNKITEVGLIRALSYVSSGVDILFLGDDIGMQQSIMMSEDLYVKWIFPRLKYIIDEVKRINRDIIIFYHSCGYIEPLIPYLIEAGVDVLSPIQSECMDFGEIHKAFGNQISFHGTIGTQETMPFGTPQQVKSLVVKNLDIAGKKGGLFVAPTHIIEPEVPWDNIVAYIEACREYV